VTDTVLNVIAVALTLMVLSRILGDNPLFRAAQYLFVGASLGLAFVIAYHQVLRPAALSLSSGSTPSLVLYGVPLALGLLLLPRISGGQRLSWLANIPLALIFGVGAALALGGAILGTIVPQILDTTRPVDGSTAQLAGLIVLVVGTVVTLSAFYYTVPREGGAGRLVAGAAVLGHWVLMVAFGFFFASAVQTYLSALTERLGFVIATLRGLIGL
jgi:FtsH-binding integral membrane protein